jgi:hypothetical protein
LGPWVSLNSDGQQYQSTNINQTNNHLSPQFIKHQNDHNFGNPDTGMGQTQQCDRVKLVLMGSPFDNWISNSNTDKKKLAQC